MKKLICVFIASITLLLASCEKPFDEQNFSDFTQAREDFFSSEIRKQWQDGTAVPEPPDDFFTA